MTVRLRPRYKRRARLGMTWRRCVALVTVIYLFGCHCCAISSFFNPLLDSWSSKTFLIVTSSNIMLFFLIDAKIEKKGEVSLAESISCVGSPFFWFVRCSAHSHNRLFHSDQKAAHSGNSSLQDASVHLLSGGDQTKWRVSRLNEMMEGGGCRVEGDIGVQRRRREMRVEKEKNIKEEEIERNTKIIWASIKKKYLRKTAILEVRETWRIIHFKIQNLFRKAYVVQEPRK